jgi:hypothetical protein
MFKIFYSNTATKHLQESKSLRITALQLCPRPTARLFVISKSGEQGTGPNKLQAFKAHSDGDFVPAAEGCPGQTSVVAGLQRPMNPLKQIGS